MTDTTEALETIWHRIQAKKYAYGHGRGTRFIDRCYAIQSSISRKQNLALYRALGFDLPTLEECMIASNRSFIGAP